VKRKSGRHYYNNRAKIQYSAFSKEEGRTDRGGHGTLQKAQKKTRARVTKPKGFTAFVKIVTRQREKVYDLSTSWTRTEEGLGGKKKT